MHRLLVLAGEAGVGKSRLADWLCEEVHERGLMIPLRARYRKMPEPTDGVVGAVNAHYRLERADRDVVERVLMNVWEVEPTDEDGKTWVAATAEWLRPLPPGSDHVGPTGKRFALDRPELRHLVIRRTLERIGKSRPILLWMDDLHYASPGTFDALYRLHRDATRLGLMIVGTVRSEALEADADAKARMERLIPDLAGERLDLAPLNPAQTYALLRETLPLDETAIQEAAARSKGNPLFALQLVHAWAGGGHFAFKDGKYFVPKLVARGARGDDRGAVGGAAARAAGGPEARGVRCGGARRRHPGGRARALAGLAEPGSGAGDRGDAASADRARVRRREDAVAARALAGAPAHAARAAEEREPGVPSGGGCARAAPERVDAADPAAAGREPDARRGRGRGGEAAPRAHRARVEPDARGGGDAAGPRAAGWAVVGDRGRDAEAVARGGAAVRGQAGGRAAGGRGRAADLPGRGRPGERGALPAAPRPHGLGSRGAGARSAARGAGARDVRGARARARAGPVRGAARRDRLFVGGSRERARGAGERRAAVRDGGRPARARAVPAACRAGWSRPAA